MARCCVVPCSVTRIVCKSTRESVMPKLKRVGSIDGGSSCKGCYYQSDTRPKCTKPEVLETCCVQSRIGKVRFCIFVEDKESHVVNSNGTKDHESS
jgi:hypothetical protein